MSHAPPKSAAEIATSARATRSPFVRLTELITGIEPGKPPINLTVGEPQHPIPPFVGDVVQRSLKAVRAISADQRQRARSPRRGRRGSRTASPSPRHRHRERTAGAQRHPRRTVSRGIDRQGSRSGAHRTPRDPGAEPVLRCLCCRRRRCRLRAGVPARDQEHRISARSRCAR